MMGPGARPATVSRLSDDVQVCTLVGLSCQHPDGRAMTLMAPKLGPAAAMTDLVRAVGGQLPAPPLTNEANPSLSDAEGSSFVKGPTTTQSEHSP
jgi:hypothetical protein